jgi:hypothetical protein
VARVCVPVADSCHNTMVLGELVNIGILYRWPHQPLLFKKVIKKRFLIGETDIKLTSKFHIKLTSKFHIKLTSKFHIKLTLKIFEFSYQNKEKYQKNKTLIRDWYVGKKIWSGNMEVFDRSLTLIPIEMHTKYISNFHIKYISNSDQFVSSGCGLL